MQRGERSPTPHLAPSSTLPPRKRDRFVVCFKMGGWDWICWEDSLKLATQELQCVVGSLLSPPPPCDILVFLFPAPVKSDVYTTCPNCASRIIKVVLNLEWVEWWVESSAIHFISNVALLCVFWMYPRGTSSCSAADDTIRNVFIKKKKRGRERRQRQQHMRRIYIMSLY